MPQISVTTTITTLFDVPEGVSIDRIRQLGLPVVSDNEEATEEVFRLQQRAISETLYGAEESRLTSVEHAISELSA